MWVTCPSAPLEPFPHEIATIHIQPYEWDMSDPQICGDANVRLKWLINQENLQGTWHYVGMISPSLGGLCNGWAGAASGDAVWVKMKSTTGTPPWTIGGGRTLAHEVGHSRLPNPDHINCKGNESPPNGSVNEEYPYPFPNCRFSAASPHGFYGLDVYYPLWPEDVSEPAVLPNGDPNSLISDPELFPLMGYLSQKWTEPYTYCTFLNSYITEQNFLCDRDKIDPNTMGGFGSKPILNKFLLTTALSQVFALHNASRLIMVSGMVNLLKTNGAGHIRQVALQQAGEVFSHVVQEAEQKLLGQASTGKTACYRLEVIDDTGAVLSQVPINPSETGHEVEIEWAGFVELLPYPEGASIISLVDTRNTKQVASRTPSTHTPSVRLISPETGTTLKKGIVLAWNGNDDDSSDIYKIYAPLQS